ncbi:MAG: gliding motility-associated C-terminal domain-containing protein [Chitinophagales bacterium]|nr:gliding motility-associated C-terminal domain-containing protein [Chitinophagales bacterium]
MKTSFYHYINFIPMNKSLISFFTVAFVMTIACGCTAQEDDDHTPNIISEKYEPCCSDASEVNFELTEGFNVYIPNVFTPNADGINDYFYPIYDTKWIGGVNITYFVLYDSDDHSKRRVIFHRDWFNPNNIKDYAFDGYSQKEGNRKLWEGQFWYEIWISIPETGQIKLKGSACSVVCDEESAIFKGKKGCFYPAQVTDTFKGDNKKSHLEKDCFK